MGTTRLRKSTRRTKRRMVFACWLCSATLVLHKTCLISVFGIKGIWGNVQYLYSIVEGDRYNFQHLEY